MELIESGATVLQETRRYDEETGKTHAMRTKEDAHDYRYFPDPDLPPIELTDRVIRQWQATMGELPDSKKQKFMQTFGLTAYDSEALLSDPKIADYFEEVAACAGHYKIVANLLITELLHMDRGEFSCPISAEHMGKLAALFGDGIINSSTVKRLLKRMWQEDFDPTVAVEREGLSQINDRAYLEAVADEVLQKSKKLVEDYQRGKEKAFEAIMGAAMAQTSGKANPVLLGEIVRCKILPEKFF